MHEVDYLILEEFSKFPKRKDDARGKYKYGRAISSDEELSIKELVSKGYMTLGFTTREGVSLTASITPLGEREYLSERNQRKGRPGILRQILRSIQ